MMGTGVGQNAGNAETVTGGVPVPPLVVEHVTKSYEVGGRIVPVIGDLSLTLREGEIVSIVGLSGFADHYPSTLSGGMRQRVALARTLVHEPDVLLLDEPFAALDFQSKLLIESDTAALVRQSNRSLLLITHDIEEAVSLADRVIVLSKRPTRVTAVYDIALGAERTDMIAMRQSQDFSQYVRRIWADLDVV